ncbi:MAG TPA: 30S ribosome-binding factor RbfA [Bryobacteraceae bacterium]|jgi:ribosome-binding factor A
MDSHRAERVSEALREELGEMIAYELSDPRIADATVTEVLVSPDMRHAQVRLHLAADLKQQQATLAALEGARHLLRRQLAERLSLFRIPELHFEADVSLATDARMEYLLKRVRKGRPRE